MGTAMGSFGSAMGYYALAFIMVIWMVIKIARGSALMALATFFIWPLAIISLIKNWGDPDTDIRIPFFAATAALLLSLFMVGRGVDHALLEAAPFFSEEELAMIAAEDPEAYALIMQARGALEEKYRGEEEGSSSPARTSAPSSPRPGVEAPAAAIAATGALPAEPATQAAGPDLQAELAQAVHGLSYLYAGVALPAARSQLALPSRFRFVPAVRLQQMARLRSQPLLPGTLGWISHDTVDLGQPDAWVMELRFLELGPMRLVKGGESVDAALPTLAGAPALDGSGRTLGSGAFAPQWDPARPLLTWSLVTAEGKAEHRAAVPLRHGVLLFSNAGLTPEQREMGLRATRLLASGVTVEPDWVWQDRAPIGARAASLSLLEWMQGREPPAAPAAP